jgi:hypothetical protein
MSRKIPEGLAALFLAALAAASHAQQASLRRQMGEAAFQQAGLQKLDPQELHALEAWLARHGEELARLVPVSQAASAGAIAGRASPFQAGPSSHGRRADDTVSSHVAGRFDGWGPGSVLRLENGQQWRVSDDSSLTVAHALDHPAVTVRPGLLGGWLLKVQGYHASARVEPAN